MDLSEIRNKIDLVKNELSKMQKIAEFITDDIFIEDETGQFPFDPHTEMKYSYPDKDSEMQLSWNEIKMNVPPGFSIDGNLVRHLSFNQASDWLDIRKKDIPREYIKIEEYKKQLSLVEYLQTLHPEVSRVSNIVLNGDFDAALKTVYATLDSKIRLRIHAKPDESTVSMIGNAFKTGKLSFHKDYNDSVRNFLQGVLGLYRNYILHNTIPTSWNSIDGSLSLFAVAHEAFKNLDRCTDSENLK